MSLRTGPLLTIAIAMMAVLLSASASDTSSAGSLASAPDVLPVAVWYGGGKARAPMLERDARAKKELWRKDVRQINALGFNTMRAWIDWASGEPAEQAYHFDTLDVLLELAEEEGLKLVLQVYMDSAPQWIGKKYPDSLFVSSNGGAIQPGSSLATVAIIPACARRMSPSTQRWRSTTPTGDFWLGSLRVWPAGVGMTAPTRARRSIMRTQPR